MRGVGESGDGGRQSEVERERGHRVDGATQGVPADLDRGAHFPRRHPRPQENQPGTGETR